MARNLFNRNPAKELTEAKAISKSPIISKEDTDVYLGSKDKHLLCHFMKNKTKEVGRKKIRLIEQEVTWAKRIWEIKDSAIITDIKGLAHIYFDINEADGVLSFKKPWIDTCSKCGNEIKGADARNARDLLKRRTISALWGIDNTHTLLLLIMGIVLVGMMGAMLYFMNQASTMQAKLDALTPKPTPTQPGQIIKPPVTGHFIIGAITN